MQLRLPVQEPVHSGRRLVRAVRGIDLQNVQDMGDVLHVSGDDAAGDCHWSGEEGVLAQTEREDVLSI